MFDLRLIILSAVRATSSVLISCVFLLTSNAAEDVDWGGGKEALREAGPDSAIVGTRWGMAARKDDVQVTFKLEISTDLTKGGWVGDVRAPEKFYVSLYALEASGLKRHISLKESRAVGPDAQYGGWKEGPATAPMQMLQFPMEWDDLKGLKSAETLVINYASFDARDDRTDILVPLATFKTLIEDMETSIRADGAGQFLMTKDEIENTPMVDLPPRITDGMQSDIEKVSEVLSKPVSDLMKLSMNDVKALIDGKADAEKAARKAAMRKQHQAIYDMEPDWFDLNVCPKPDVSQCNKVGKLASEKDQWFDNVYEYGKIMGVVWRSKGSINHIYGGSLDLDIDPKITRANTAQYYYILKNDEGHIQIRPTDGMDVR